MPLLEKWHKDRGEAVPKRKDLPTTGYIADGRVAGWLYMTDSSLALIEGIISDPNTVPSLRKESLNKLVGFLIDLATSFGYTNILGLSKHPSILQLGQKYGFKEMKDYKFITLTTDDV